jgi:hypothetical protein
MVWTYTTPKDYQSNFHLGIKGNILGFVNCVDTINGFAVIIDTAIVEVFAVVDDVTVVVVVQGVDVAVNNTACVSEAREPGQRQKQDVQWDGCYLSTLFYYHNFTCSWTVNCTDTTEELFV